MAKPSLATDCPGAMNTFNRTEFMMCCTVSEGDCRLPADDGYHGYVCSDDDLSGYYTTYNVVTYTCAQGKSSNSRLRLHVHLSVYLIIIISFFLFFFSVRLVSVLRGHSVCSSPPQRPMTSDFEGFSIPDFIHYIFSLS